MGQNNEYLLRPGRLGKKEAGNTLAKQLIDKSDIVRPVRIHAAVHPIPASIEELRKLGPLTIPKQPRIDKRNLGTANEALHSHPTDRLLAQHKSNKEIKNWHRKLVIYGDDSDRIMLKAPDLPKDLCGERQREDGCRRPEEAERNFEERVGGTIRQTIPAIRLVPPPEGDVEPLESRFLAVDGAYKVLYRRSERENRGLSGLRPLAFLLAEAEGIDPRDTAALLEALEGMIEDRQRLRYLLPVAATLCEDQGIDFETEALENLPRALDKVLKERETARSAARHEKRAKQRLERRVLELDNKLSSLRCDEEEEDYIRY
ncbi:hypothetical protein F5Y14DRAFT_456310 [Nemania sp. NC0429]|nr:hypothetical protein F5Y14DRAFT_456310 [Nemania sp. NC0429]